jgi:hypothetical protein
MSDYEGSSGDGYGWAGHGAEGDGDDDGMSGFGDVAPPGLTLPGGQVVPFPDLGGGGLVIPGIPPSGPNGPPPNTNVQVQTGAPPEWIAGIPNTVTVIGAIGVLLGAVMLFKK